MQLLGVKWVEDDISSEVVEKMRCFPKLTMKKKLKHCLRMVRF